MNSDNSDPSASDNSTSLFEQYLNELENLGTTAADVYSQVQNPTPTPAPAPPPAPTPSPAATAALAGGSGLIVLLAIGAAVYAATR